jgi:type VI secretion system protein ImpB
MATNIYDKIKKVRKPRVQISYDLEDGGASVKKELPFVVGVLGDFSGNPTKPLKSLKQRKFINISGENFNEVLESMAPGLEFNVDDKIKNDGKEMPIKLAFKCMDDFSPARIAESVQPLKKLLETRANLKDLLSKADRSEALGDALEKLLQNEEHLRALAEEFKSKGAVKPEDQQ